jgi:biopolymer transport protein ExbD
MLAKTPRRRRWGQVIAAELNLLPLMNLFVVLIPLLLLSAVFLEVAVIDMSQSYADAPEPKRKDNLGLRVVILSSGYAVEGKDLATRTIGRPRDPDDLPGAEAARAELGLVLQQIVAAHPGEESVLIVSQPTTLYEDIIAVMDLSRAAGLTHASLAGAAQGVR